MNTKIKWMGAAALAALCITDARPALASSHREAPQISDDPAADGTDFYMFRSPTSDANAVASSVTLIANYWPLQEPGGGPNWVRFNDGVLYEIKIDNNGDAKEDITYQFRFKTQFKAATSSFLFAKGPVTSAADQNLNVVQTYTVTRIDKNGKKVIANNLTVPPPHVGTFTMGPATTTYDNNIAFPTIGTLDDGNGKVFAGQRDDPFFVDLGAVFDLVRIRCNVAGGGPNTAAGCAGTANVKGVDFVGGYNVHTIAIQVPISKLTTDGSGTPTGKNAILGAWTTASRPRVTIRRAPSLGAAVAGVGTQDNFGQWVQVSRLGLPLINEVIVPVGFKDYFNSTPPSNDAALFTSAAGMPLLQNPELHRALKALYGGAIADAGTTRTDILDLVQFHIGGANGMGPFKGKTYGLTPADILRVDVSVDAPANLTINRMGALGVVFESVTDANFGFPNGRRLQDDVVDVLERVVGGGVLAGVAYTTVNGKLSDGVDVNDRTFLTGFPYVPAPWSASEVGNNSGANSLLHQFR